MLSGDLAHGKSSWRGCGCANLSLSSCPRASVCLLCHWDFGLGWNCFPISKGICDAISCPCPGRVRAGIPGRDKWGPRPTQMCAVGPGGLTHSFPQCIGRAPRDRGFSRNNHHLMHRADISPALQGFHSLGCHTVTLDSTSSSCARDSPCDAFLLSSRYGCILPFTEEDGGPLHQLKQ